MAVLKLHMKAGIFAVENDQNRPMPSHLKTAAPYSYVFHKSFFWFKITFFKKLK